MSRALHDSLQASRPWFIAIAASAGGIQALQTVLAELPADLPAAVAIVQHRTPTVTSMLEQILARVSKLPVQTATADDAIVPGRVYVARPDLHLIVQPNRTFGYVNGSRVRGVRSSGNPLLDSAAKVFGDRAVAVVLTGAGLDATDGVQAVKARGGIVVVQDPESAMQPSMPLSALRTGSVDHVVALEDIAAMLVAITAGHSVGGALV
jgi:two-component system chemotaxis response regulator CheB